MKRILSFLLAWSWPGLLFAQTQSDQFNIGNLLNPPAIKNGTDLSIAYLQNIFGVVDGVLHGSGSQILGKMFAVFNGGALVLGLIIVAYTTIASVLKTAHEGEVLGRQWSSIWIPLRTVLGIALLVPKATGYSTIQIFMMWAIVQGVAIADSIWNEAIVYLAQGGVVIQQALAVSGDVSTSAKNIFKAETCMFGMQAALDKARQELVNQGKTAPNVPILAATLTPITMDNCKDQSGRDSETCHLMIPGNLSAYTANGYNFTALTGMCGMVTWQRVSLSTQQQQQLSQTITDSQMRDQYAQQVEQTRNVAVQQMVLNLQTSAQTVINTQLSFAGAPAQPSPLHTLINNRIFLDTASDYQGIMGPVQRMMTQQANLPGAEWMVDASSQGWITAGNFYRNLAHMNNDLQQATFKEPIATVDDANVKSISNKLMGSGNWGGTGISSYGQQLVTFITTQNNPFNLFITTALTLDPNYGGRVQPLPPMPSMGSIAGTLLMIIFPIFQPLYDIVSSFYNLMNAQATNVNPVVSLSVLGNGLINLVVVFWIAVAAIVTALTAALSAVPSVNLSNTISNLLIWIMPLLTTILLTLLVNGAVLAYYVPLIPFIIFVFGAIGWLLTVIEAMAAAPLIALGITHPEGHEVLGKADPAVLLLVSVFIRPSMMIIGLIAGIIMSYVGVWLLNKGFSVAFFGNLWGTAPGSEGGLSGFAFVLGFAALLVLYTVLVIGVINISFSLIEDMHSRIMSWLGARAAGGGESQKILGEAKGAVEGAAGVAGQYMGKTAEGAGRELEGKGKEKEAEDKGRGGAGSMPTGGGGGPTSVGPGGGDQLNVGGTSGSTNQGKTPGTGGSTGETT